MRCKLVRLELELAAQQRCCCRSCTRRCSVYLLYQYTSTHTDTEQQRQEETRRKRSLKRPLTRREKGGCHALEGGGGKGVRKVLKSKREGVENKIKGEKE
jgi:hypothetical protein